MAIKNDREYRIVQLPEMQFRAAEQEGEEPQYIVEGYATTYDDPYTLFEFPFAALFNLTLYLL